MLKPVVKFRNGDRVRIRKDAAETETGKKWLIHPGMTQYLGKETEIREVNEVTSEVVWYTLKITNTWRFCEEWLEPVEEEKGGCSCDIRVLMAQGCKCGGFAREKGLL